MLTLHVLLRDLNRLVMDYLVIEGFKSAAEEFSREAGVGSPVDLDSIESRIVQLQEKKSAMIDATLSTDDSAMGRLTPEDVRAT